MASYINLDALLKYPIRRSNYDKEHGSEEFINGVESVIEYAKSLHTIESPVGHAYWTERDKCGFVCSKCEYVFPQPYAYCEVCGSEMSIANQDVCNEKCSECQICKRCSSCEECGEIK